MKYPVGKGMWCWQLRQCLGGDVIKLASVIEQMGYVGPDPEG